MKELKEGIEYYSTLKNLRKVKASDDGWTEYYIDDRTNEKWIKTYPHPEYHGGGSAILRTIEQFPWEYQ